jgi:Glyoxalase-like domain
MPAHFQLVIDCADPDRLARFWAAALGYELEPPPAGFPTWDDYYRDLGVPEEDLDIGADSISDPQGRGPRIWFQVVPETKAVKNRLHLDIHASGGRTVPIQTRKQRVDAEASRLAGLGATITGIMYQEGLDHYGVSMTDPEGNEFDIN